MFQSKGNVGLEVTQFVARIVAIAEEFVSENGCMSIQFSEPVGELNLSFAIRTDIFQDLEDPRGKDVSSDNGKIRRRCPLLGFFNHVFDSVNTVLDLFPFDDSIEMGFCPGNLLNGYQSRCPEQKNSPPG